MYMVEALAADGRTVVSFHDVFGSGTHWWYTMALARAHRAASVRPSLGLRVLLSKVGRRSCVEVGRRPLLYTLSRDAVGARWAPVQQVSCRRRLHDAYNISTHTLLVDTYWIVAVPWWVRADGKGPVCPSFGNRELIRLVLNTREAYKCGRLACIVCIFEKASNRSIFILYKTSFGYEIFFVLQQNGARAPSCWKS